MINFNPQLILNLLLDAVILIFSGLSLIVAASRARAHLAWLIPTVLGWAIRLPGRPAQPGFYVLHSAVRIFQQSPALDAGCRAFGFNSEHGLFCLGRHRPVCAAPIHSRCPSGGAGGANAGQRGRLAPAADGLTNLCPNANGCPGLSGSRGLNEQVK